jgi:hypothetical protein
LQRDAAAWNRLVSTLVDAERDAKEAFLEPVLKRVDPFLRLLFPDARVTLNEETLEITGVVRGGREEPYPLLSIGTREQLSILFDLPSPSICERKDFLPPSSSTMLWCTQTTTASSECNLRYERQRKPCRS